MALKSGLQLFLRLNEPSGSSIIDYSPNSCQVQVSGTDQRALIAGQTNTNRSGMFFNGQFYLSVPDNSAHDFTGAHTVRFRLNTNTTGTVFILSKNSANIAGYDSFMVSPNIRYVTRPVGLNYQPTAAVTGQWYDIVFRVNYVNGTGQSQLYVNSVSTSFQGIAPWTPANSPLNLAIGADFAGGTRLTGALQDFTLYNRALSDAEISGLYQQTYSSSQITQVVQNGTTNVYSYGLGTGTYYKIIGGSDSGNFTISDDGLLAFRTPVNGATPADANRDGKYEVSVMIFNDTVMNDTHFTIYPYMSPRAGTALVKGPGRRSYSPYIATGNTLSTGLLSEYNNRFDDYTYYTTHSGYLT